MPLKYIVTVTTLGESGRVPAAALGQFPDGQFATLEGLDAPPSGAMLGIAVYDHTRRRTWLGAQWFAWRRRRRPNVLTAEVTRPEPPRVGARVGV
jgi:hypothetical protein